MLANLIENGIRHNQPGGGLSVATSTSGDSTEVTVRNGGAVIDPAQVQALTEPFRRLSRRQRRLRPRPLDRPLGGRGTRRHVSRSARRRRAVSSSP